MRRMNLHVLLAVAVLALLVSAAPVAGEEGPAHSATAGVTQNDAQYGDLAELIDLGRLVFTTPFNEMDGLGDGPSMPPEGRTALAIGVQRGHAAVVEALLGGGAEADGLLRLADLGRLTPLAVAARLGRTEIVGRLVAAGADPNRGCDIAGVGGSTPMDLAVAAGHLDVAEALWQAGGDPCGFAPADTLADGSSEDARGELRAWLEQRCPLPAGRSAG